MAPTKPKTIMYTATTATANSDEEEFDQYGEFAVPERNAMIVRYGRLWKKVRAWRETRIAIRAHLGVGDLDVLFEDAGHADVGRYTLDGNHEEVHSVFCRLSDVGDGNLRCR